MINYYLGTRSSNWLGLPKVKIRQTPQGVYYDNVDSSNLERVSYDPFEQVLTITFLKYGDVYEYYDVPLDEFQGLMIARSHGKYFHNEIRNRYKYRKIA